MTGPQLAALRPRVKSPFFDGLAPRELDEVLRAARQCRYRAGAVVASQGTPANSLFLLVSGRRSLFYPHAGRPKDRAHVAARGGSNWRSRFAEPAFRLHRQHRDRKRQHNIGLGEAGHPPTGHTLSAIT